MRKTFSRALGSAQAAVLASALVALSAPALAQSDEPAARPAAAPAPEEPPRRRLDRLEREVDEVRSIVLQARATGHPVEIKEAGPDPEVVALQAKVEDLDSAVRRQTGQLEQLGHDLTAARQDAADAKAEGAALADRIDKLEKQLAALTTPPPPPPPPANDAAVPQAETSAPAGDSRQAYAAAKQLMNSGDYAGAAAAFQAYIDHYGDQPSAPSARYWLGEVKYAQEDYSGAATALIAAIRGWPQTSWAPDAVIKLSQSLVRLNKPSDACATLSELERRYPRLPPATKARAAAARTQAQCTR